MMFIFAPCLPYGTLIAAAMLGVISTAPLKAAVVYEEDFSSTTLTNKINPYLGGWFASALEPGHPTSNTQIGFGEWANASGVTITVGETLSTPSDSGFRGAAIALDPTIFPAAGTYTLTYDVDVDLMEGDGTATVNVWSGSGYDLNFTTGDAIQLDTESGILDSYGNASSSLLASGTHTVSGLEEELSFTYDGTRAIVLFFGTTAGSFPFPTAEYDNISISGVPEPSSALLIVLASFTFLRRRR